MILRAMILRALACRMGRTLRAPVIVDFFYRLWPPLPTGTGHAAETSGRCRVRRSMGNDTGVAQAADEARWQFWIDRGGTFTDVVALTPDRRFRTAKLLSDNPERYEDAAVEAIRRLTGIRSGPLPRADIRLGTTVATNALLERKGEPLLLAITRGFGDALRIGTQERPDIFARHIVKPAPLPAEVLEVDERIGADGTLYRPLDEGAALAGLCAARARGLKAVAIVLMHGYRHTAHEERLAELAAEAGFAEIAVSHRVSRLAKLIGRADTTAVDAYLSPVLAAYVGRFSRALGTDDAGQSQEPLFMQSSGGLSAGDHFRGRDAILSGPAGGIVGMAETARAAGYDKVIGFDMGGTSTDVSLFAGSYERDNDNRVAGVRIRAPMLRIHTVAAGGGSVCSFDGARFLVGPESAGAQPGPACYRQGGPLTITDCNLVLGKLQPGFFPAMFGPGADERLDRQASLARMAQVTAAVRETTGEAMSERAAAEGFVAIAVAGMANAIRAVSVARGHDAGSFALNCFGGAGGQHACLVADALGIATVLVHRFSGVLSAYGMGLADRRETREATLGVRLDEAGGGIEQAARDLFEEARQGLIEQGVPSAAIGMEGQAHIRPAGGDSTIEVPLGAVSVMRQAFAAAYRARFGYDSDAPLVLDMLRIDAVAPTGHRAALPMAPPARSAPPEAVVAAYMAGAERQVAVHAREKLAPDRPVAGPALIVDPVATIAVEPGWSARMAAHGMLVLTRAASPTPPPVAAAGAQAADPVRLEIFGGLFMAIAEEMGAALQHSARSVNIRERLDFSCALFDATGALVANAPHIPVHLGSMGESVKAIMASRAGTMRKGEVYALNAPYNGGTHLPDITVIQPVFTADTARPAFFVAARGHHADIGGIAPGSMPSDSTHIEEEGIVLDDVLLVEDGHLREAELRALLGAGPYPARNIDQNVADLAAQIAACRRGAVRLLDLVAQHGEEPVAGFMEALQAYSAEQVRARLGTLAGGSAEVAFDNGAVIRVAITIDARARSAVIDFAGTSAQLPSNFNAPQSVVRAACLYAIRTLFDLPIPLNDGFLRPVAIRIPKGSLLAPEYPAAVVAGNVETSQLITDALMLALGAMAASQGTMNNFTFGDETRQYYETIAGGSGAGPDGSGGGFPGADAVQTHMTNSRLTDPEVLEQRFPVLVERFAIRRGSGGAGAWPGGEGAERRIRFLAPMRANILSNRRTEAPPGLAGGGGGACGANRIERADGTVEQLAGTAATQLNTGDVFVIETPGGAGYKKA